MAVVGRPQVGRRRRPRAARWLAAAAWLLAGPLWGAAEPCRIEVVERGTDWPVPLVELRTVHQVRLVSDNAGQIALDLPELMGHETWFHVSSPGYEIPPDGFGQRGIRLTPKPGVTLRVEVARMSIARRLGRLTGAGQLAESARLGLAAGAEGETGVLGCDSVQCAEHRGKLHWLWGDTAVARYPLGVFHSTSATTAVRPLASSVPPVRIEWSYFRDAEGGPRGVARMPGEGPTWVMGMVSLPDRQAAPRLVGCYLKIRNLLEPHTAGLCAWNDEREAFEPLRTVWTWSAERPDPIPLPWGHAVRWQDAGEDWVLFGNPLPVLRCRAKFEEWHDPERWERVDAARELRSSTGGRVVPHSGSVGWSAFRRRWVTVFVESGGSPSSLGELWYAEADRPTGPWGPAVKVLSHENYTFYNPRVHAEWGTADSPVLCFEGTYTSQFANRPPVTPRYDYNQVLYRLDLDDPRLAPARGEAAANSRATPDR